MDTQVVFRIKLVSILAVIALLTCAHSPLQQESVDLTILVRDVAGAPMGGVTILLYREGPPRTLVITTETDVDGFAEMAVAPGGYVLVFSGNWQGHPFISPGQQNAGVLTSGDVGGFGLYLDPCTDRIRFMFVITEDALGQLVPRFDLSRRPEQLPQPYTYDDASTGEVAVREPVAPLEMAPLVVSPETLATLPDAAQEPAPEAASGETGGKGLVGLAVAVGVVVVIAAGLWVMVVFQFRQRRGA